MAIVANKILTVKSPAFSHNGYIPFKYTCNGSDINPELIIAEIPKKTKSLALIVDDPSAPMKTFDHWLVWNIPVMDKIEENSVPGIQGKNSNNENKYIGPCPPSGIHYYHFRVYALDIKLDLPLSTNKNTLLKAIEGHILGLGELVGGFKNTDLA